MSLNLGLNPVQKTEQTVSLNQFISASIECQQIDMELDREIYKLKTMVDNTNNFNEIVTSLKKHASAECLAFAEDLLGISVSLEADDETDDKPKADQSNEATKKQGSKVMMTLKRWWTKFRILLLKIKGFLYQLINSIKLSAGMVSYDEIKVSFTLDQLKEITDAFGNDHGPTDAEYSRIEAIVKENKSYRVDTLSGSTNRSNYLDALQTANITILRFMEKNAREAVDNPDILLKFRSIGNAIYKKICKDIVAVQKAIRSRFKNNTKVAAIAKDASDVGVEL